MSNQVGARLDNNAANDEEHLLILEPTIQAKKIKGNIINNQTRFVSQMEEQMDKDFLNPEEVIENPQIPAKSTKSKNINSNESITVVIQKKNNVNLNSKDNNDQQRKILKLEPRNDFSKHKTVSALESSVNLNKKSEKSDSVSTNLIFTQEKSFQLSNTNNDQKLPENLIKLDKNKSKTVTFAEDIKNTSKSKILLKTGTGNLSKGQLRSAKKVNIEIDKKTTSNRKKANNTIGPLTTPPDINVPSISGIAPIKKLSIESFDKLQI
jgi:hypothetical protein